jgi:hypothetical protein
MKRFVMAVLAAACVLTGCSRTTEGVVAQTTEPVSVQGMKCADFNALGDRDKRAVIDEIMDGKTSRNPALISGLADVLCRTAPEADVERLLRGLAGR